MKSNQISAAIASTMRLSKSGCNGGQWRVATVKNPGVDLLICSLVLRTAEGSEPALTLHYARTGECWSKCRFTSRGRPRVGGTASIVMMHIRPYAPAYEDQSRQSLDLEPRRPKHENRHLSLILVETYPLAVVRPKVL